MAGKVIKLITDPQPHYFSKLVAVTKGFTTDLQDNNSAALVDDLKKVPMLTFWL